MEKVGLAHIKKVDWAQIGSKFTKELICNIHIINQYTKLQGRQINMGIKGVVENFKLPYSGLILGRKEGYNISIASYFVGEERDHYVPRFGYIIIQTNKPLKIMKL